ncbi:unnamed protein product [Boreogadus saida]
MLQMDHNKRSPRRSPRPAPQRLPTNIQPGGNTPLRQPDRDGTERRRIPSGKKPTAPQQRMRGHDVGMGVLVPTLLLTVCLHSGTLRADEGVTQPWSPPPAMEGCVSADRRPHLEAETPAHPAALGGAEVGASEGCLWALGDDAPSLTRDAGTWVPVSHPAPLVALAPASTRGPVSTQHPWVASGLPTATLVHCLPPAPLGACLHQTPGSLSPQTLGCPVSQPLGACLPASTPGALSPTQHPWVPVSKSTWVPVASHLACTVYTANGAGLLLHE